MAEVSLDFIGRQLDNLQIEFREFKLTAQVERQNLLQSYSTLVREVGTMLATFEVKIEHRLDQADRRLGELQAHVDRRLGDLQEHVDGRLDRIEAILAGK
jgi:hypothetical protein